jgi:hypothetical protein
MENIEPQQNKIERILNEIDKDRKVKWIETITTILLSAATVLSAWCVYEASQWNGEQYFRIEDENNADRKRMQKEIAARQRQVGESQLFLQYVDAVTNDNKEKEDFLRKRFPPHLNKAALAWKELDPLNNPNAPISPMQMEEYVLPEEADIEMYAEQAKKFKLAANECDNRSDNYMLLSLVLSTVLFFCGLVGVTNSRSNKLILLGFATFIFLVTLYFVIKFPVLF